MKSKRELIASLNDYAKRRGYLGAISFDVHSNHINDKEATELSVAFVKPGIEVVEYTYDELMTHLQEDFHPYSLRNLKTLSHALVGEDYMLYPAFTDKHKEYSGSDKLSYFKLPVSAKQFSHDDMSSYGELRSAFFANGQLYWHIQLAHAYLNDLIVVNHMAQAQGYGLGVYAGESHLDRPHEGATFYYLDKKWVTIEKYRYAEIEAILKGKEVNLADEVEACQQSHDWQRLYNLLKQFSEADLGFTKKDFMALLVKHKAYESLLMHYTVSQVVNAIYQQSLSTYQDEGHDNAEKLALTKVDDFLKQTSCSLVGVKVSDEALWQQCLIHAHPRLLKAILSDVPRYGANTELLKAVVQHDSTAVLTKVVKDFPSENEKHVCGKTYVYQGKTLLDDMIEKKYYAVVAEMLKYSDNWRHPQATPIASLLQQQAYKELKSYIEAGHLTMDEVLAFRDAEGNHLLQVLLPKANQSATVMALVKMLLDNQSLNNKKNHKGETVLHHMAKLGMTSLYEQYQDDFSATLNLDNKEGVRALTYALAYGHKDFAFKLYFNGARVKQKKLAVAKVKLVQSYNKRVKNQLFDMIYRPYYLDGHLALLKLAGSPGTTIEQYEEALTAYQDKGYKAPFNKLGINCIDEHEVSLLEKAARVNNRSLVNHLMAKGICLQYFALAALNATKGQAQCHLLRQDMIKVLIERDLVAEVIPQDSEFYALTLEMQLAALQNQVSVLTDQEQLLSGNVAELQQQLLQFGQAHGQMMAQCAELIQALMQQVLLQLPSSHQTQFIEMVSQSMPQALTAPRQSQARLLGSVRDSPIHTGARQSASEVESSASPSLS